MAELAQLIGAIGRQTIELGGDNYVFDPKKNIWMNEETKEPADPFIQKIIKDTYKKIETGRSVGSLNVRNVAKSYGIVGSAAIRKANPKALIAANNDEPILPQELAINKPLVQMINVLASIDGFLKQRLENQRVIGRNNQLAARENQIEQKDTRPQIDIIKPDAEKVEGSNLGLYALGGLALLTLDPVQEALKDIVNGVVTMGGFVTDVAKSINGVFKFLLGGSTSSSDTIPEVQPSEGGVSTTPAPEANQGEGPVATPVESESAPAPAQPEKKSSFLADVGSAALTGATIGSIVPRAGPVVGAVVGGAIGAVTHFTGGGSSSTGSAPQATQTSAPPATSSSAPATTQAPDATQQQTSAGEIPKNDIVALGNYLASQGADKSKMEHMSLSGRVGEHSQNSRHYRGMAIDVNFPTNEAATLDKLKPQLEAAGYNVIWRQKDHYDHMHVSVGGPEGGSGSGDSYSPITDAVKQAAGASLEAVAKLFGVLGGAIVKPGIAKTDLSSVIANAAKETNADIAVAKTPKQPALPPAPAPPNINKIDGGATQNPATAQDKNSVYYYLRRFGYQELSVPEKTLKIA